ncbi:MAG: glycosyltransferase family 4 protein [Lachnospiraceae bacterium]|nr:glycosyltransferase family 4 protein [Lachnospiraceae bacterium]
MNTKTGQSLNIWLVRMDEILPCDGENPRLLRMGLIAEIFASKGHQVTWWCSTLNRFTKEFRYNENKDLRINENLILKMIHSYRYTKNMSFKRIKHHAREKRELYNQMLKEQPPDIILSSMPSIEAATTAAKYARKMKVPLFIDVRDTFPDMYLEFCSKKIRPFLKIGIIPYKLMLAKTLKSAKGIFATSERFLEWALKYAKRERQEYDNVYFVSYPDTNINIENQCYDFWKSQNLSREDFICCFFGQFGFTVDIETVLEAARILYNESVEVKFVICGVGERLAKLKKSVSDLDNIIFPGWVDRNHIAALGKLSSAGLMAYRPGNNYEWSMPNKFCEYLALGITVLLQPTGVMKEMIDCEKCGIHYKNADELANAIIQLKKEPQKLQMMKQNARSLYDKSFRADITYGKMVDFIEKNYKGV